MSKHILRKHVYGFTTVSNNVIKVLKCNLPALGLYLYLLSLPNDWEFYKTKLAKDFKIGIKKLEKLLRELSTFGLIQYGQKRDEHGRFTQFYMHIYDTESLKNKDLDEDRVESTQPSSPEGQNCRTAETVGRFREATKEVITKEELIKQNKSSCSSRDERVTEFTFFDTFWSHYPRKQKRLDALRIWKKNNLEEIAQTILEDVEIRKLNDWHGRTSRYIPLPTTYLNGKGWLDDIIAPGVDNKDLLSSVFDDLKKSNAPNELMNF